MSVQLPILHHAYHPVIGGVASSRSSLLETPFDPAEPPPPAEPSADDDVYISRGGRALRKRKMIKTPEPPARQPSKRTTAL